MNKRLLILYLQLKQAKETTRANQLLKLVMTKDEIVSYLHYESERKRGNKNV